MIKKRLIEDTVEQAVKNAETQEEKKEIQKANVELDDPLVSDDSGEIESELSDLLEINRDQISQGSRNFQNCLFVGEAGTGKTARIKAWARKNKLNLVTLKAGELDDTDTGGVLAGNIQQQVAVRLASTEFDQLEKKDSVLFLDEWNRAPSSVRQSLLTLIQDHTVTDPRIEGRMRFLPNFLFTVAAINPDSGDYDVKPLDPAEMGRVEEIVLTSTPENWVKYMSEYYTELANRAEKQGNERLALINKKIVNLSTAIGENPDFDFDTTESIKKYSSDEYKNVWNHKRTTPRTLTNAIVRAKGDKEEFLKRFNNFCNNLQYKKMEDILNNYVDIDDKANQALKSHTPKDKLFKSQKDRDLDELDAITKSLNSQLGI